MIIIAMIILLFICMLVIAGYKRRDSVYFNEPEEKNPMEGKRVVFVRDERDEENADGVRGHLEIVGETKHNPGLYERYVKRMIDIILSFFGLVILSPVFAVIILAIKIDDPGPVLFTQKRVGKNKQYFKLHKFRSMKMSTPHDVPTHMLDNPEQYITKVGKFLRKHSLDELPQIWDIFIGNMSVIGPRPALWNQDVLTAERDRYGVNDVIPGLTGWAQINGRDELTIEAKAKLDGEYVKKLSVLSDMQCFFGTIGKVASDDSIVEGSLSSDILIPENIKVSVIVSTYRRDQTLKRALQSLASQSYKNIEIIIIDDNASFEWNRKVECIINNVCEDFNLDIKCIVNDKNYGSAATRNKGIFAATGSYITFLDDDDVYLPLKIEEQLKDMISTGADYGLTDLKLYTEKEKLAEKRIRFYIEKNDIQSMLRYHLLYHMTGTDTLMFKTDYLRKIGGFCGIDIGDEFYLMKDAILAGGKSCYSAHCYVKAYIHEGENGGLSSGKSKIKGENSLFNEKKKYYSLLSKQDIRYIEMRHYAVLAFTELRMKKYLKFLNNAVKAFIASPFDCLIMVSKRK